MKLHERTKVVRRAREWAIRLLQSAAASSPGAHPCALLNAAQPLTPQVDDRLLCSKQPVPPPFIASCKANIPVPKATHNAQGTVALENCVCSVPGTLLYPDSCPLSLG